MGQGPIRRRPAEAEPVEVPRVRAMRRRGLDPPRVLPHRNLKARTAPVSTEDSSGSVRQGAANSGAEGQGSGGGSGVGSQLREALASWNRASDPADLRRRLLEVAGARRSRAGATRSRRASRSQGPTRASPRRTVSEADGSSPAGHLRSGRRQGDRPHTELRHGRSSSISHAKRAELARYTLRRYPPRRWKRAADLVVARPLVRAVGPPRGCRPRRHQRSPSSPAPSGRRRPRPRRPRTPQSGVSPRCRRTRRGLSLWLVEGKACLGAGGLLNLRSGRENHGARSRS